MRVLLPPGAGVHPTVFIVHGGFWKNKYTVANGATAAQLAHKWHFVTPMCKLVLGALTKLVVLLCACALRLLDEGRQGEPKLAWTFLSLIWV